MNAQLFLMVIGVIAVLIVLVTVVAVVIILRQPDGASNGSTRATNGSDSNPSSEPAPVADPSPASFDTQDPETYLAEQRANLDEFQLADVSNGFRGTTQDGERRGLVSHLDNPDAGVIAFTSQIYSDTNGVVKAETVYGSMELVITQGRAGVRWDQQPLGILDYTNKRILGPEGQLLGSMERPDPDTLNPGEVNYYPIGFFGQHTADVVMSISASSTLRWFGDQDVEQSPAFRNIAEELEDEQTLLLLSALLLEFGFFNVLG